jgi:hypothetical protein
MPVKSTQQRLFHILLFLFVLASPSVSLSAEMTPQDMQQLDPAEMVFSEGFGSKDFRFNDPACSAEYIKSRLGQPDEETDIWLNYNSRYGIDFLLAGPLGPIREIRLNKGFKGQLSSGITPLSKNDVFAIYGKPAAEESVQDLSSGNGNRILYKKDNQSKIRYRESRILFWFDGDRIDQIVLFPGPFVQHVRAHEETVRGSGSRKLERCLPPWSEADRFFARLRRMLENLVRVSVFLGTTVVSVIAFVFLSRLNDAKKGMPPLALIAAYVLIGLLSYYLIGSFVDMGRLHLLNGYAIALGVGLYFQNKADEFAVRKLSKNHLIASLLGLLLGVAFLYLVYLAYHFLVYIIPHVLSGFYRWPEPEGFLICGIIGTVNSIGFHWRLEKQRISHFWLKTALLIIMLLPFIFLAFEEDSLDGVLYALGMANHFWIFLLPVLVSLFAVNLSIAKGKNKVFTTAMAVLAGLLIWFAPMVAAFYIGENVRPAEAVTSLALGISFGLAIRIQHAFVRMFFRKESPSLLWVFPKALVGIIFLYAVYLVFFIGVVIITWPYFSGDFSEILAFFIVPLGLGVCGIVGVVNALTYSAFTRKGKKREISS